MGLGSFVDINIFIMKYYLVSSYSPFIRIFEIKIYLNVKTPKWKLESLIQRHSLVFSGFSINVDFDLKDSKKWRI